MSPITGKINSEEEVEEEVEAAGVEPDLEEEATGFGDWAVCDMEDG